MTEKSGVNAAALSPFNCIGVRAGLFTRRVLSNNLGWNNSTLYIPLSKAMSLDVDVKTHLDPIVLSKGDARLKRYVFSYFVYGVPLC